MTEPAAPMTPFVGLRSFQTADAEWFFGREREKVVLTRKIRSNRFTAVVGASGSGKSSLVLAGVLPELQADSWKAIVTKPGSTPITRLAETLAAAATEEDDGLARACVFQFDASLRASAFGLAEITAKLVPAAPRLVLVVDQFEELFRYGENAGGSERAAMREEGRAFVELLLAGAARTGGRLHVVLTMRSDYCPSAVAGSGWPSFMARQSGWGGDANRHLLVVGGPPIRKLLECSAMASASSLGMPTLCTQFRTAVAMSRGEPVSTPSAVTHLPS